MIFVAGIKIWSKKTGKIGNLRSQIKLLQNKPVIQVQNNAIFFGNDIKLIELHLSARNHNNSFRLKDWHKITFKFHYRWH